MLELMNRVVDTPAKPNGQLLKSSIEQLIIECFKESTTAFDAGLAKATTPEAKLSVEESSLTMPTSLSGHSNSPTLELQLPELEFSFGLDHPQTSMQDAFLLSSGASAVDNSLPGISYQSGDGNVYDDPTTFPMHGPTSMLDLHAFNLPIHALDHEPVNLESRMQTSPSDMLGMGEWQPDLSAFPQTHYDHVPAGEHLADLEERRRRRCEIQTNGSDCIDDSLLEKGILFSDGPFSNSFEADPSGFNL